LSKYIKHESLTDSTNEDQQCVKILHCIYYATGQH